MGMKIVTGRTGAAHVTSADDGARNAGIIGTGKYIFNIGNKFAYEIISNNLIRVKDGCFILFTLQQPRHTPGLFYDPLTTEVKVFADCAK